MYTSSKTYGRSSFFYLPWVTTPELLLNSLKCLAFLELSKTNENHRLVHEWLDSVFTAYRQYFSHVTATRHVHRLDSIAIVQPSEQKVFPHQHKFNIKSADITSHRELCNSVTLKEVLKMTPFKNFVYIWISHSYWWMTAILDIFQPSRFGNKLANQPSRLDQYRGHITEMQWSVRNISLFCRIYITYYCFIIN